MGFVWQGTYLPCQTSEEGIELKKLTYLTIGGHVKYVTRGGFVVVVPVVVAVVFVVGFAPVLTVGRNVKTWPSVVIISVVLKPVGTGKVNLLQNRVPDEEVTTTPPGKVSVDTPVWVGFGRPVGRNVKV